MNCVEALRSAATKELNTDKRYMLYAAATLLEQSIEAFRNEPSSDNLRNLNGVWAYAWRVLQVVSPTPQGVMSMPDNSGDAA